MSPATPRRRRSASPSRSKSGCHPQHRGDADPRRRQPRRHRRRQARDRHRLLRPHARPDRAPRPDRPRHRCQGRPAHRRPPHGGRCWHHFRSGNGQGSRRQEGLAPLRPCLRAARRSAVARCDRLFRPAGPAHAGGFQERHDRRTRYATRLRVLPWIFESRRRHAAHRQHPRRQRAPPVRNDLQGVRAGAADGAGNRSACS